MPRARPAVLLAVSGAAFLAGTVWAVIAQEMAAKKALGALGPSLGNQDFGFEAA